MFKGPGKGLSEPLGDEDRQRGQHCRFGEPTKPTWASRRSPGPWPSHRSPYSHLMDVLSGGATALSLSQQRPGSCGLQGSFTEELDPVPSAVPSTPERHRWVD